VAVIGPMAPDVDDGDRCPICGAQPMPVRNAAGEPKTWDHPEQPTCGLPPRWWKLVRESIREARKLGSR
jgi:hypothetical protein